MDSLEFGEKTVVILPERPIPSYQVPANGSGNRFEVG
jgi:hypothetical protein